MLGLIGAVLFVAVLLAIPAAIILAIVRFFLNRPKSDKPYKVNYLIKDLYVDGFAEKKPKPKKKKVGPPYKLNNMIKDLRFDEYIHMKEQSKMKKIKENRKENTDGNQT